MPMKTILKSGFLMFFAFASLVPALYSQAKKPASSSPQIDVQNYKIEVNLKADSHEFTAVAVIDFKALESTNRVSFELSENISVQRVLSSDGADLEFGQDETESGILSIRFGKTLSPATVKTIRIEYEGGFDRDRYSRIYARDEGSAYIGMEGTYLLYSAKWIPIHQLLIDRATETLEVTAPLGMTVIGGGSQLPVVTKGIYEVFGWTSKAPVLPGSFVAGQYFQRRIQIGDFTIECFARDNKPDAMQKNAEEVARILQYYRAAFGPSLSGNTYRLVEVDDVLARQSGMAGTIFVTRSEFAQSAPPVHELARRIACQWWQETIGIRSTEDLWLADGMAYLSAAQYLGKAGGPEAFKEEIDNLAVLALKFESQSAVREGLGLGYRTDKYESVVAGKGAWILNMLRGILGEKHFQHLTQKYIQDNKGRAGSTAIFEKLAEEIHGKELGWFFAEWIDTTGVPAFQTDYVVFKTANGFRVSGTIKQDRDLFRMPVEIAVVSGGKEDVKSVDLSGKATPFDVDCFFMPDKIILDPNNKLLRDSTELQTSVQLSLANDLRKKSDFVGAVRAYENALRLAPNRSLAHFGLAEVFFEQFNLQSAANSFRDALNGDKDPKWIEVWSYIYLGKIYDILGQRQRAMAEYTKAVNTKDDFNGAQAEANKWLAAPFTRERTTLQPDGEQ